jgi:hypothetical protein
MKSLVLIILLIIYALARYDSDISFTKQGKKIINNC